MEDVAAMRRFGEIEGREDAMKADPAGWYESTLRVWARPSRRVTQAEADAYLAAYEAAMLDLAPLALPADRLRELAAKREGVQS